MNTVQKDPAALPAEAAPHDTAPCSLIITVESGRVTDILPTGPVEAVVVDLDMIEDEDSFEHRMRKAILPLDPDGRILPRDMNTMIAAIVREYRRPGGCKPALEGA